MAKLEDITRTKPLSLDELKEYGGLEGFSPPEGSFDPGGTWRQIYRRWLVQNQSHQYTGFVEIERRTSADAGLELNVKNSILLSAYPAIHDTTIRLKCAADALCTPKSWEIRSEILDIEMKPIELSRVEESASVSDGNIEIKRGGRTLARKLPGVFTSDYSLFEAVQRLPKDKTAPLEFALLQDLDEVKEGQRLSYREKTSFEIGGKMLALHCYQQIGRGILPYKYYVDEMGRLVFAISGLRAYILDPNVMEKHKKAIEWLTKRGKK